MEGALEPKLTGTPTHFSVQSRTSVNTNPLQVLLGEQTRTVDAVFPLRHAEQDTRSPKWLKSLLGRFERICIGDISSFDSNLTANFTNSPPGTSNNA